MKRMPYIRLALLVFLSIGMAAATASADDIKTRMKKRLPQIIELKAAGIIGETHQGYLDFVGKQRQDEDLIAAENQDRRRVYEAIAKQQGTTAELVGQRRAMQLANMAKDGEWIQDSTGKWKQK